MKIGIDIDDTITDTYCKVLEYISAEKNIDLDELKSRNYDYDELYKGGEYPPMSDFIWDNFSKLIPVIEPKPNAKEIMEKIIEDGHEIILITARSHALPNQNKEYLEEKKIPYTKLYEKISDKAKVAREEGIKLFIDDSERNCKQVLSENIKVLLFDAPYNKKCSDLTRVENWESVYDIINRMQ